MPNQFTTSIWGDEGFSAILSMKSLPEILSIIANDTSPPLWNITEHIAFQLFGTAEIVIRGLAFSYFLATIFFVYKIGKYLFSGKVGILAAILTFFNPFFFTYAFEGRMYSILALGVTASMYFFLKLRNPKDNNLSTKVGYVVSTLWAMYSHHFAIFILVIQGMWFLYELLSGKRKTAVLLLKVFIAVGVGYIPWLIPLYNQTKMVGGGFWLGTPTIPELIGLLTKYLGAGIEHSYMSIAVALTLIALAIKRWWPLKKSDFFLISWFLGPIVLTWAVSQVFQSIFFDRYLLYAIPGAMLLASSRGRKFSGIIIGLLIVVFVTIDIFYFTHPVKRPFRELAAYVKSTRQETDYLINWNAGSHHLWETKYYDIPAPIYIPEGGELPYFVGTALMEENDIIHKFPDNINRVGVITSGSVDEINLPGYTEEVTKVFKPKAKKGSDIKFVWFQAE